MIAHFTSDDIDKEGYHMTTDILFKEAQGLSEKRRIALLDYLRYLKYLDSIDDSSAFGGEIEPENYRKPGDMKKTSEKDRAGLFGSMPGIVMHADFDDPIEEFEEYM